jgi:YD repeat-containing protein
MGNQTVYAYNEAGEKTSETWLNPGGQQTYQANYTYDLAGNLTSASDPSSAYVYSYDADNEMTQQGVTYPALSTQPLVTLDYTYDGIGDESGLSDSLGGAMNYVFKGGQLAQLSMAAPGAAAPITVGIAENCLGLPAQITYSSAGGTIFAAWSYLCEWQPQSDGKLVFSSRGRRRRYGRHNRPRGTWRPGLAAPRTLGRRWADTVCYSRLAKRRPALRGRNRTRDSQADGVSRAMRPCPRQARAVASAAIHQSSCLRKSHRTMRCSAAWMPGPARLAG